jgi:hypothetical protein
VVGEIIIEEGDWPWLSGHFLPAEGFAEVKPLFDRELALLEEDEQGEWDAVAREIGETLQLVAPTGRPRTIGPSEVETLRHLVDSGKTVTEAARTLKISRSSAYAALKTDC